MSNVESAFQRLVNANPEPNPSALVASNRPRTAGSLKGSEHMTTEHMTTTLEPSAPTPRHRRTWMPAVAAAAAVIVVIAAIPFVSGGNEFAAMTDAEIATAFLAGEVDEPSDLLAPDAVIEHRFLPTGDVDGWFAWREVVGETNSDIHCVGDGEVNCTFTFQLDAAAAQDLGPYPFNSAAFSFEDGLITRFADLTNPNDAARDVWNPFFDWLAPELHAQMYQVTDSGQVQPLLSEDALGLWEDQMDSYIAVVSD